MVHQYRTVTRTDPWKLLVSYPDPTVPVLTPDDFRILVEPVAEKEFPLHVHTGAGQRISLSDDLVHRSTSDSRPIDGDAGLVDDPEQLEEEPAIRVGGHELGGPLQCARSQLVVRVEKEQVPTTGDLGTSIPGEGPFVVQLVHDDPQVHPFGVTTSNTHRVICRCVVDNHYLTVFE